jgi:hypothetical protein
MLCNVQSLTLRAHSASEMEEWIAAIMAPLSELSKLPESATPSAAAPTTVAAAGAGASA